MEFRIEIVNDELRFRITCVDAQLLQRGFYEALSDPKIDEEDRHLLLLSITDALISIVEEKKDYAVAQYNLERFIEFYNASSTIS